MLDGWTNVYTEARRKVSTEGLWKGREVLSYDVDIIAEKNDIKLGVEIDNPDSGGGHSTQRERAKDKTRTRSLQEQHMGLIILRFEFWQLKGISNEEIIGEIEHEIRRHVQ